MSADVRLCPYDGKKLRSDNSKGICSACQARGRTLANAPTPAASEDGRGIDSTIYDVKAPSESRAKAKPARKSASDTLKRFRVVADALDEDADALLEAFAESWLAQLKERVSGS